MTETHDLRLFPVDNPTRRAVHTPDESRYAAAAQRRIGSGIHGTTITLRAIWRMGSQQYIALEQPQAEVGLEALSIGQHAKTVFCTLCLYDANNALPKGTLGVSKTEIQNAKRRCLRMHQPCLGIVGLP